MTVLGFIYNPYDFEKCVNFILISFLSLYDSKIHLNRCYPQFVLCLEDPKFITIDYFLFVYMTVLKFNL